MDVLQIFNPEYASEKEINTYSIREAARAVVFDSEGKIALLYVATKNYYKLPGGGLEGGEDRLVALERECVEEIGCDIEVLEEIGLTVEHRKMSNLKQISYCYLGRVRGEKSAPQFTEKETTDGFEIVWLSYEEALHKLATSVATSPEGEFYIVPRDRLILEKAKNLLVRVFSQ